MENLEKSKLIETKLGLIYAFAGKAYFSVQKYYPTLNDLINSLVVRILEDLDKYDPNKGALSTYFYLVMDSECKRMRKKCNTATRKLNYECLSLDAPIDIGDDCELNLYSLIPDKSVAEPIHKILYQDIASSLSSDGYKYFFEGQSAAAIARQKKQATYVCEKSLGEKPHAYKENTYLQRSKLCKINLQT